MYDDHTFQKQDPPLNNVDWKKILKHHPKSKQFHSELKKQIFKGIPSFLRYKIYSLLLYEDLKIDFEKYKSQKSDYEYQIDVDIQRTFRNHILFKERYGPGQCRLFNVLVAFSNYDPNIGYCQGMSYIVSVILMYFPEKEAFDFFVKIIKKNRLENLFDKSLSKLNLIIHAQRMVSYECIPELADHFNKEDVDYLSFVCSWYLTLFTRFNLDLTLRIWDLFIFYDFSILVYLVAAILKYFEKEILVLKAEQLIEFIVKIERGTIDIESLFNIFNKMVKGSDIEKVRIILGTKRGS